MAESFLREFSAERRRDIEGFTDEAVERLESHPWPGNVRELRNVVERAVLFCRGTRVTVEELPSNLRGAPSEGLAGDLAPVLSIQEAVTRAEAEAIMSALVATQGRRAEAAELLGISRKTLWEKMKALEISVD